LTDDYGNPVTEEKVLGNLCRLLDGMGIFKEDTLRNIFKKVISNSNFPFIEDKALEYLAAVSPAMAQILTLQSGQEVTEKGTFNWWKSWVGKDTKVKVERKKFNY
jgi:hypothetical protein